MKYFLLSLLTALSVSVSAQTDESVLLRWKLQPSETITYKTQMQSIDSADSKIDISGMLKAIGLDKTIGNGKDAGKAKGQIEDLFVQLKKQQQQIAYETQIKEKLKGILDVKIVGKPSEAAATQKGIKGKQSSQQEAMIRLMSTGVMLRGLIDNSGATESFYTKNDQKNMISFFFQLPANSVKPGDTWPLSVNLISMDQNFDCDSAYKKNEVTLVDVKTINGERIAEIQYDILEYVSGKFTMPMAAGQNIKSMMKIGFVGHAQFSVDKGRWISYDGVFSLISGGMLDSKSYQRLALVPN